MFQKIKQKRIIIVFILMVIIAFVAVGKIFFIQVFNFNKLNSLANSLWQRNLPITANRGKILDRNGQVLATNITTTTIYVVPNQIKNKEKVAHDLANILNAKYDDILAHLNKKTSLEKINPEGRKLSSSVADKINALNYDGVYLMKEAKRYYPNGKALAHVLGFVGIDNQGLSGLELQYDKYLTGKDGAIKYASNGKGQRLNNKEIYEKPQDGIDITLTIDLDIQLALERELENAMSKYNPEEALAVVMDPNTGEILAMASNPSFDGNNYQNYRMDIINHNLPIWKNYEPGSTFKMDTPVLGHNNIF